jgi:hypothetical protein
MYSAVSPNQARRRLVVVKNVGTVDKVIRLILVVVVVILYATKAISGTAAIIVGISALMLLLTSIVSYCPLYSVIKVSTRKKEKTE